MSVESGVRYQTKSELREPRRYRVIMHNDDYTPMDFVVQVLMEVFGKEKDEAVRLMFTVHKGGSAVVGSYSYDIARTKVRTVTSLAREEGYPFRLTIEEE